MNEDRDWVEALARGLQVLGAFTAQEPTLTVTKLSERTGLPKATISRLTYTLSELGFLRRIPGKRVYAPGAAILALGHPMLATLTIRQVAQPFMRELSDETQSNVSLSLLDRDRVVYVETCRAPNSPGDHRPDIGLIWPLTVGTPGRALIAGMREPERTQLLNVLRVQHPGDWVAIAARFEESTDDYKRMGFCASFGEIRPNVYGAAVPVSFPIDGHWFAFNCAVAASPEAKHRIDAAVGPALRKMVDRVEHAMRSLHKAEHPIAVRRVRSGRG